MDKVQFNNEVVIMRKTVKKVKVQVVKNLSRQIKQLRNKKGKPEELEKNKRRCDRLVEVIQAMKRWVPDDVTYSALMKTGTTNEVMETAREKALTRLIKHPVFVKRLATFKDLVTPDLLQSKRRHKKPNKVRKEEEKIRDEDDESLTKELKESEANKSDMPEQNPSESHDEEKEEESDEEIDEESNEDEGETFFLSSKRGNSQAKSTLKSNPPSDETITNLRSSNSTDVGDIAMTSLEDDDEDDEMVNQEISEQGIRPEKRPRGTSVAKVDLPNQTAKQSKHRHIPGISAPIFIQSPEGRIPSNRGRGRGTATGRGRGTATGPRTNSHSDGPLKNMSTQVFSNRGRGRGRGNNSISSYRGGGKPFSSNSHTYQEQRDKSSLPTKKKEPFEDNKDKELHPSWLAKKREKAVHHFAGKKTTFSDG